MSASYFIYYRTDAQGAEVRRIVRELQDLIARDAGIRGRLMRRADDASTWMEVYEGIADCAAFDRVSAAAIERSGFARLLGPGVERHVERFVPG